MGVDSSEPPERMQMADMVTDIDKMRLEVAKQFCDLLSKESSYPIEVVIKAGVIPRFVEFLQRDDFPQLQFEASWVLINVTAGSSVHTKAVTDLGAIPIFVKLLSSKHSDIREQAVWALGNISGDSTRYRNLVLLYGALIPLLGQLITPETPTMLRTASWTLYNLCGGRRPPFTQLKPALPVLERLLHSDVEMVLRYSCWSLCYLSDGANGKLRDFFETGVCSSLIALLSHHSDLVLVPALRTINKIFAYLSEGSNDKFQVVFEAGVFSSLIALLNHHSDLVLVPALHTINKMFAYLSEGSNDKFQDLFEAGVCSSLIALLSHHSYLVLFPALRALNKIFAGSYITIQFIVDSGVLQRLLSHIAHNVRKRIQKEACLAVSTIAARGSAHFQAVVEAGLIGRFVNLLRFAEFGLKKDLFWAMHKIMSVASQEQTRYIVSQGCLKPLCDLLACTEPKIIFSCLDLLEDILEIGEPERNPPTTEGVNSFVQLVNEAEGHEKIETLHHHYDSEVRMKAMNILKVYWLKRKKLDHS